MMGPRSTAISSSISPSNGAHSCSAKMGRRRGDAKGEGDTEDGGAGGQAEAASSLSRVRRSPAAVKGCRMGEHEWARCTPKRKTKKQAERVCNRAERRR